MEVRALPQMFRSSLAQILTAHDDIYVQGQKLIKNTNYFKILLRKYSRKKKQTNLEIKFIFHLSHQKQLKSLGWRKCKQYLLVVQRGHRGGQFPLERHFLGTGHCTSEPEGHVVH